MNVGPELDARELPVTPGPAVRWPSVTVIVPVHGDRGELAATTRALAAQDYPGPVDVVVVDNGDNEDLETSIGVLADVQLLQESTPGSYAARNAALASAAGEVLAFTDGDCLPRSDWLSEGVSELLAADGPAFVGGAIELFPADASRASFAELWDCTNGLRQDHYVGSQGWAATANMMTTRATFDLVGPFEQTLKSGGDREWGERAVVKGVQARFGANAVVDHPARPTMAELHKKVRRVTRGEVDKRRVEGRPMFDAGELRGTLRPNVRSIVRTSQKVSPSWTKDRIRYVAVAQWLQYYFLAAKVAHVVSVGRTTKEFR